ncbi:MAG: c-type cytochrome [Gammaproteobacteria bacterium]
MKTHYLFFFLGIAFSGSLYAEAPQYTTTQLAQRMLEIDQMFNIEQHHYDKNIGDEINQVCAGCHNEFGMGGKEGKYPRLAGQPVSYILRQVMLFRERLRPNITMIEHVEERQLPNDELIDIAIYLSKLHLNNRLSIIDETAAGFDAYARLQEAESVIQIGRSKGNITVGKKLYRKECKSCHGKQGEENHEESIPMLAGQYTVYLQRQLSLFKKGIRLHDPEDLEEAFFKSFSDNEIRDILAYISMLDD